MTSLAIAFPGPALPAPRALARWLWMVAALVLAMVVVGGITRLTESGLSITRWEPVSGALPPLDRSQWQAEFARYRATPEGRMVNAGMTLEAFKRIYFWEYVHRLLGRMIGLAFALPLAWFWWRRMIPTGYGPRLVALLALGALQGAIGWWMVASGLVDRPDVSHLRLAVHLGAAFLILGGLAWTALDLAASRPARLRPLPAAVLAMLALQLLLGALTAGLDAGFAFASWPKMGGEWFPAGGWNPAIAAVDNPVVVQFVHRWFAWAAAASLLLLAWRVRHADGRTAAAVAALVAIQIILGVATLLSGVALPVAIAHQAVAALLLLAAVAAAHRIGRR